MKKFFNCCALALLLSAMLALQTPNSAVGQEKPVTIAVSKNYVPFSFISLDGKPRGLLIDIWNLWSEATGVPVLFIPLTWKETLERVKAGTVDIHFGLFKNKEREEWMDFSSPIHEIKTAVYSLAAEDKSFQIIGLQTGKVGTFGETYQESYLKKQYPNIEINRLEGYSEMISALMKGDIDYAVGETPTFASLLSRLGLRREIARSPDDLLSDLLYAGVRKGNTELLKKINNGFESLSFNKLIELDELWLRNPADRFYRKITEHVELSGEEEDWLAVHPFVRFAVTDFLKPIDIVDKDGKYSGLNADIIALLNKKLGTRIVPDFFSKWSDAAENALTGKVDGIFSFSRTPEREKHMLFTNPYAIDPIVVITRQDNPEIKGWSDLGGKRVSVVKGFAIADELRAQITDENLIEIDAPEDALHLLALDETDAHIGHLIPYGNALKKSGVTGLRVVDTRYTQSSAFRIAIHKSQPILFSIIQKGINALTRSELKGLQYKWLSPQQNQEIAQNRINLTQEEREWLTLNTEIQVGMMNDNPPFIEAINKRLEGRLKLKPGSRKEHLEGLKDGRIDALLDLTPSDARRKIYNFTEPYLSAPHGSLNTSDSILSIGVRKDWPILASILQKALNDISQEEFRSILKKWVRAPESTPDKKTIPMTEKESAWLQDHKTVRVMVGTWPPFHFMDKGEPKGMALDYVKTALKRIGLEIKYVPISWTEALKGISSQKKIDLLPTISHNAEREKRVAFTQSYLSSPRVIFARKEDNTISSLKDLYGRTVAVEENFITQKLLKRDHPKIKLYVVASTKDALEAVSFGKADAFVSNLAVGSYLIADLGLLNLKVTAQTSYKNDIQSMGVRKDWPELASLLDKVLNRMSEKEKRDIRDNWLSSIAPPPAAETKADGMYLIKQIGIGVIVMIILLMAMVLTMRVLESKDTSQLYQSREVKGLGLVLIGAFLCVVVLSAWYTMQNVENRTRQNIGYSLQTTLYSTHQTLRLWADRKQSDLKAVSQSFSSRTLIKKLLEVPRNQDDLLKSPELLRIRKLFNAEIDRVGDTGFFVIAPDGISIASMRNDNIGTPNLIFQQKKAQLDRVFKGETILIPPMASDQGSEDGIKKTTMFIATPVRNTYDKKIIAALTMRIDPKGEFSRINQLGRAGLSGETYSFNRKGNLVSKSRFDSELRQMGLLGEKNKDVLHVRIGDPGGNLKEGYPLPADLKNLPLTLMAAQATVGKSGLNIDGYRDYRGVPVLGAWLWDEELGLGMATEVDLEKSLGSYFTIRKMVLIVLGVTVLISLVLTGLSTWIGRSANRSLHKARDDLERKVEERTVEVAEKEAQLRLALDSMTDGIFMLDHNMNFALFNDRYKELMDLPDGCLQYGTPVTDVMRIHAERGDYGSGDIETLISKRYEYLWGDKIIENELSVCDGKRFVSLRKAPTEGGGPIVIISDITERKRTEEEMLIARDAAEEAARAKASFLATMSHEIRTPMNGIIGMVDMLVQSKLEDDQYQMLHTVQDSAYALLTIINDILDFSKIEAGKLELENIPLSIRDAVEGVCETLAPNANKKNLRIIIHVDPDIPDAVLGDQVRIRQILFNIAGNAVKFTNEGRILIRAFLVPSKSKKEVTVRFEVIDFGIGISEKAQSGLFKEFSQAESSTTRRFGGTGLGLSICQRLVEIMKGKIEVESELGKGSKFTVTLTLPVAKNHTIKSDGHDLSGLSILFAGANIEESELDANVLRHWGADVTVIGDINEAKAQARDAASRGTPPDIIVLAATWPMASRIAGIEAIQAEYGLAETRFVLFDTGRNKAGRKDISNTIYIESGPLRRIPFIRGIAIAAGRASPDISYEHEDIPAVAVNAPDLDDAEAAGTLILVAEDNPTNRDVIGRQLNLLGYAAEFQNDGKQALEAWKSKSYAILLTDCHMPEMDGFELTQAIREIENNDNPRLPIIAITASVLQAEVDRCFESGMDDFLAKPLEMTKLKTTLKKWMPPEAEPARKKEHEPEVPIPESPDRVGGPIDPQALKSIFGDDDNTFKDILQDFIEPATNNIGEIKAAFGEHSPGGVAGAAHKLKSSARSVGAIELADLCLALEMAGKADIWDDIVETLPRLEPAFRDVMDYIESL